MGNREDLLAGARKAILERGVAKTTARDIASAAGVSLAAIGYHFGSKDRLITEALAQALGTGIGDGMEALVRDTSGLSLAESFARMMNGLPQLFAENREGMLASMENLLRIARSSESREFMGENMPKAFADLAGALREAHPNLEPAQADALAKLYFVLTQGLSVLFMILPEGETPDGAELAQALATITADPAQR